MGWRCEYRVVCDQCSALGPRGPEPDSASAERRAVKAGWLAWRGFYGRMHACPDCRGGLNEDLALSLADSGEARGNRP